MPIYEYSCPKCGEKKEVISTYIEKVSCKCGEEMKRLFPQPAFKVYTKI